MQEKIKLIASISQVGLYIEYIVNFKQARKNQRITLEFCKHLYKLIP